MDAKQTESIGVLVLIGLCLIATAVTGCNRASDETEAAQAEPLSPPIAQPDFDRDGVADLGYIEPQSTHELVYVLQAPNDTDLTNLRIESDCPCVEAVGLPDSIPAGQSAPIRIRFIAPDKVLYYQQDLAITPAPGSTAGRIEGRDNAEKIWLTIDARLGLPLRVTPEELHMPVEANIAEVAISNEGPEPIKLIYALSNNPLVKAAVSKEPIDPGGTATIQITTAEGWVSNGQATTLRIKTTHDNQPELIVYVETETQ